MQTSRELVGVSALHSRSDQMAFYTQNHQPICGINWHTKTMFLCSLYKFGKIFYTPTAAGGTPVRLLVLVTRHQD
jgi:ubiquinone biosynthesis protein COQ9